MGLREQVWASWPGDHQEVETFEDTSQMSEAQLQIHLKYLCNQEKWIHWIPNAAAQLYQL